MWSRGRQQAVAAFIILLIFVLGGRACLYAAEPVVFFSGGTFDDCAVHIALLSMKQVDLRGVVLSNSDCLADYAMVGHWKVSQALDRTDVPLALSLAKGWNAFPYEYRKDSITFAELECLAPFKKHKDWPPYPVGEDLLAQLLADAIASGSRLTLLVTAPVTPVVDVLRQRPELEKGVARMLFMGGAVNVPGNLDPNTLPKAIANPKAEWNVFWDPRATQWLLENTTFEIIVFPLDLTNKAKVTDSFKQRLQAAARESLSARIAAQAYGKIWGQPFYRLWNTTAASYLAAPDLFEKPVAQRIKVMVDGFEQGSMVKDENGREVQVVFNFKNPNGFYDLLLKLLSSR